MDTFTKLISDCLNLPEDLLQYEASRLLAQIYPDKYIFETEDYEFELKTYAARKHCAARLSELAHAEMEAEWLGKRQGARLYPRSALFDVSWRGEKLKVLTLKHDRGLTTTHFIVADSEKAGKAFFSEVCRASSEVSGEILVFSNGCWKRDPELIKAIKHSNLENLIISDGLRQALLDDFEGFFASEKAYASYKIPWKRGLLMMGPPGNGKTHAIKAMINRIDKPCLYVRSFQPNRGTVHAAMQSVFYKAREVAPCIVVMEDLDSLVDEKNRSFFLNEMDGFAQNHGVLTVATTNHPDKLDPALLERPSRFDRKITFNLPEFEERKRFLAFTNECRQPDLQLAQYEIEELANLTEGFSFAYLKELCLSGMMAWSRKRIPGAMGEAMQTQVEPLRTQMTSEPPTVREEEDEEDTPVNEYA